MVETSSASGSPAAAPQPRHVLVMPEAFSAGKKEDWSSWLRYFKNCATLNRGEDAEKRDFLAVRLRGPAQETYQSLSKATQTGTFNALAQALGRKFAPAERAELYKAGISDAKASYGRKIKPTRHHSKSNGSQGPPWRDTSNS